MLRATSNQRVLRTVCASALLLASRPVFAAGNHDTAPLGGRSALMGGTGVALAVDGAGPYLNPATLVRIADRSIAFSARFFRLNVVRLPNWHSATSSADIGPFETGSNNELRTSLQSFSDSACYFFSSRRSGAPGRLQLAGAQRFGICFAKTEDEGLALRVSNIRGGDETRRFDQTQDVMIDWERLNFGPSWGIYVSERLSIGASLSLVRSRYEHTQSVNTVLERDQAASASTYQSMVTGYSWDVSATLGATYRFSDAYSMGASLRLPALHVLGGFRGSYVNALEAMTVIRDQWSGEGKFWAKPPIRFALGFGAEWRLLRMEVDASLTAGQSDYVRAEFTQSALTLANGAITSRGLTPAVLRESTRSVLGLGVGLEYFLSERLSVLGGLHTNPNALAPLDVSATNRLMQARLNYYQAGVGLSSYTDYGDLILGLNFQYGRGRVLAVDALGDSPVLTRNSVDQFALLFVIAGTVQWKAIEGAAKAVGDTLQGGQSPPSKPPEPMVAPKRRD